MNKSSILYICSAYLPNYLKTFFGPKHGLYMYMIGIPELFHYISSRQLDKTENLDKNYGL